MLTILSPAKTLDFTTNPPKLKSTIPKFLDRSLLLIEELKSLTINEIAKLMNVSEKIAELNKKRFEQFAPIHNDDNSKYAIFAYNGDVYKKMDVNTFTNDNLEFAQDHLLIVSGLYGLLRPLDLIQPYRLEMVCPLKNKISNNLYSFWRDDITTLINEKMLKQKNKTLVILASREYYEAIDLKKIHDKYIHIDFKESRNGELKTIALLAKKARGLMSRFIIQNNIDDPDLLRSFKIGGYKFDEHNSTENNYIFVNL